MKQQPNTNSDRMIRANLRVTREQLDALQSIAAARYEGNLSQAARHVIERGLKSVDLVTRPRRG